MLACTGLKALSTLFQMRRRIADQGSLVSRMISFDLCVKCLVLQEARQDAEALLETLRERKKMVPAHSFRGCWSQGPAILLESLGSLLVHLG